MLKEIHEQPEAIRAAIAGRIHEDEVRVPELEPLRAILPYIERIELVACGTAAYAAAVAANALQAWTGLPARWNIGSEFRYDPPPLDQKTLVIAVTQSGETADTLAPTRLARERGCPVVAVTNTVGSAITREADAVLFLQAGPEIAVVATKTFVTQVITLLLVAAQIAKVARPASTRSTRQALVEGLRALPANAERTIELNEAVGRRAGPPLRRLARLHVRRSRHHLPGGAGGGAQAQGGQLRPRRGLRRRRAQARPHLAARRGGAAGGGRHAHGGPRQARQQPHGGPRPRCARHRRGDRGRRAHEGRRRRHPVGAADGRDAEPGRWPSSRSSCSPITRPWGAARTSISRATWPSRSRSSEPRCRRRPAGHHRAGHRHHQGRAHRQGPAPSTAGASPRAS